MIRAAVYCRVSSADQNPENQRVVLSNWAKQRGFDVIAVYEEEESARKSGHQRQLARLLDDARRRRFSIVLVWALDRLSREGALAQIYLCVSLY